MARENVTYIISLQDKFTKRLENIRRNTGKLDKSINGLNNSIAKMGAAFGALQLGKQIFKIGVEFEQTEIAFQSMLGSVENGTKLFKELLAFSKNTPFMSKEVLKGAKSLLAYGIQQDDLLKTMTTLGDLSAGLGRDKLPNLILAFGQVKAATRLTGMELRQFTEAGVPLLDLLSKRLDKPVRIIKEELIPKGLVSFDTVKLALQDLTTEGGRFANMMEKQMVTTGGRVAILLSNMELKANSIAKEGFPLLNKGLDFLNNNFDRIVNILGRAIKLFVIYKGLVIGTRLALMAASKAQTIFKITTIALNRGLKGTMLLMKGLRSALISTGIGALTIGVTLLIERLISWKQKTRDQEEAQKGLNNELLETNKLIGQKEYEDFIKSLDLVKKIPGKGFVLTEESEAVFKKLNSFSEENLRNIESFIETTIINIRRSGREGVRVFDQVTGRFTGIENFQKRLKAVRLELKNIEALRKKEGIETGGVLERAGITDIKASAPKVFNINIEKLVDTINNNVTNLKEGMVETKKIVTETLLDALNQTQITALQ